MLARVLSAPTTITGTMMPMGKKMVQQQKAVELAKMSLSSPMYDLTLQMMYHESAARGSPIAAVSITFHTADSG